MAAVPVPLRSPCWPPAICNSPRAIVASIASRVAAGASSRAIASWGSVASSANETTLVSLALQPFQCSRSANTSSMRRVDQSSGAAAPGSAPVEGAPGCAWFTLAPSIWAARCRA
jgi:hypothetical protein